MSKRKKHNPERRAWRGRSYRVGGKRVRDLREAEAARLDGKEDSAARVERYGVEPS